MSDLVLIVGDVAEARNALTTRVPHYMTNLWKNGVQRIRVTVSAETEDTSLKQFKFYWGYVLKEISEQAQEDGIGAQADGWHLFYKRMFLGYKISAVRVPGKAEPEIVRELKTTTALKARREGGEPCPHKYMPDYIDAVMAHAATTYGVRFSDQRWEDWSDNDASRVQAV